MTLTHLANWHGTEPVSVLIHMLCFAVLCTVVYDFLFLNFISGDLAIFNSSHENLICNVLEDLESGQGPRLAYMCWPGSWAMIAASELFNLLSYFLNAELPKILKKRCPGQRHFQCSSPTLP